MLKAYLQAYLLGCAASSMSSGKIFVWAGNYKANFWRLLLALHGLNALGDCLYFLANSERPYYSKSPAASHQYAGASSRSCAASSTLHHKKITAYLKNIVQLAAARQSRSDLR